MRFCAPYSVFAHQKTSFRYSDEQNKMCLQYSNGENRIEQRGVNDFISISKIKKPMTWWEPKKKKSRQALAYYRHSAEGRQENSIEIQREAVHAFAEKYDIEIVEEFEDPGKSGLNAEGRDGFQALLERVKQNDVENVVCYDITRWGRFQNIDHSAAYEAKCAEHGVKVVYVVHGDLAKNEEDKDSFLDIQKALERKMAGKYSRELSQKVFAGAVKVSQQGNRAGGPAPYGTLRLEVDEQRKPIGMMKPKQHKSYPNNRVRLTPDNDGNADVIRNIFDLFVTHDYLENQIAATLNERNIPAPMGGQWQQNSIRRILQDEQYTGSVVYNKTSSKLKTKRVRNPREQWVIKPNSYDPVVERTIFEAAQTKLSLRSKRLSREEIQERIRLVFQKYNMLSYSLMRSLPDMPPRIEIIKEFGSLPEAFQSLYPNVLKKTRNNVREMIESKANEVFEYEDFLVINRMFTVKIEPTLPFPHGYGYQWYFRIDKRCSVDITLGVPLRGVKDARILGYFPFPRFLTDEPLVCIADTSSFKIGLYGYFDLRFIFDLIQWTNRRDKEPANE